MRRTPARVPDCVKGETAEGFVLAGGASSRMGRDKALVEVAGRPLVEHALGILREAGLEARIAGARTALDAFAPVVKDEGGGPLAGVCAALEAAEAELAVFLPVDMPLAPASLIGCLLHYARVTGAAVTVPRVCGYAQTFPAVVRRETLPELRRALEDGEGGCFAAFRQVAEKMKRPFFRIAVEELAQCGQAGHALGVAAARWLMNVNTPEEVRRAEALLVRAVRVS
ncbi:MAG TPA: molybdenum cofactor guanylyltransferase [Terracidiphilus sp.]|nr:molybdenum cofactor guanylyltransferase [Terracidiphilus sp.]